MATTPKYRHPEYPACTWSGRGHPPYWIREWDHAGRDRAELLINVPVTKKDGFDQAQLPGLPPVPKKRGRPATGKARTAAQRKADSRARMLDVVRWGSLDEADAWIAAASARQLLEAYPVLLCGQPLLAADVAQRLVEIALEASA